LIATLPDRDRASSLTGDVFDMFGGGDYRCFWYPRQIIECHA